MHARGGVERQRTLEADQSGSGSRCYNPPDSFRGVAIEFMSEQAGGIEPVRVRRKPWLGWRVGTQRGRTCGEAVCGSLLFDFEEAALAGLLCHGDACRIGKAQELQSSSMCLGTPCI